MNSKYRLPILMAAMLIAASGCSTLHQGNCELRGRKNFFTGYEAINPDGTVNVVIEISAGSHEKWEVQKDDGIMRWDRKNGKLRIIEYLGYPANYGMIPETILSKEDGGDGDPLDVLVIGSQLQRGQVVKAKLIGVLRMRDRGEQDDKLIAVLPDTHFGGIESIAELDKKFPGVTSIIETWFENYKGPGKMQSEGFDSREAAWKLLDAAGKAYGKEERGDFLEGISEPLLSPDD